MATDADLVREAADAGQAYFWAQGRDAAQFITAELRALLRAVAEYHPVECSFARYGHVCTPYCPRCRAEALADTILGAES